MPAARVGAPAAEVGVSTARVGIVGMGESTAKLTLGDAFLSMLFLTRPSTLRILRGVCKLVEQ